MKALFSEDGTTIDWTPDPNVAKIVVGKVQLTSNEARIEIGLPTNVATRFPNLTHLYLWHVANLEALPSLPEGLRCLDVRGANGLTSVASVPTGLETLDCGGCSGLVELAPHAAQIARFFFNDCTSLSRRKLENFLEVLGQGSGDASPVVEIDGSGCPAVETLDEFPRTLRRLVLANCPNLKSVRGLSEFTHLTHLNLSGCAGLQELPELPPSLQYLALHGAERLTRFLDQNIGPYDRGTRDRPNVATALHSRQKFGKDVVVAAHAKLLLLGDGRVGKTTLAKRLREVNPDPEEGMTHRVEFHTWGTKLDIGESAASDLTEWAVANKRPTPVADGGVTGRVGIWDFGGQEIYHQTHRLFAAEGSVFLVVWRMGGLSDADLMRDKPSKVADDEWRAWNRQRSLDYWLDYVYSIRPAARVILVCTHCPSGADRTPWTTRAPNHASRDLPCFYIDSLDDADCATNPDYRKLQREIAAACGAEAVRIGLRQPSFYGEAAAYVGELLRDNDAAVRASLRPTHLMLSPEDWGATLKERHRAASGVREPLDDDDVASITGYLHDAGQIFRVRRGKTDRILVDQRRAAELIYEIVRPGGPVGTAIEAGSGYFFEDALALAFAWQTLDPAVEKPQLLDYMQQCGIVVRLTDREKHRGGKAKYLATEKWLLPPYEGATGVAKRLEREMQFVLEQPRSVVREEFAFEKARVSEFEFRSLMVHFAEVLGPRATWFREGMQAIDKPGDPSWCFRLKWEPEKADDFFGIVDARLVAPDDAIDEIARGLGREVNEQIGTPTSTMRSAGRVPVGVPDGSLDVAYFRRVRDDDYDVGVSSSGADQGFVEKLVGYCKAQGPLSVLWYRLPECRSDENAKVMKFMTELRHPRCILLCLSDAYLNDDPVKNWYCVWELADAILQVEKKQRSIERTLVAYARGGELNSNNVADKALVVLRSMARYFKTKYDALSEGDQAVLSYYLEWHAHFRDAAIAVGSFFGERGGRGTYSRVTWNGEAPDFGGVLTDVLRALGRKRPTP